MAVEVEEASPRRSQPSVRGFCLFSSDERTSIVVAGCPRRFVVLRSGQVPFISGLRLMGRILRRRDAMAEC